MKNPSTPEPLTLDHRATVLGLGEVQESIRYLRNELRDWSHASDGMPPRVCVILAEQVDRLYRAMPDMITAVRLHPWRPEAGETDGGDPLSWGNRDEQVEGPDLREAFGWALGGDAGGWTIRALPEAPAPWQPIDTAPKDGRTILIAGGSFSPDSGEFWYSMSGAEFACWEPEDGVFIGRLEERDLYRPRWWMPIPDVPGREP